jgi:carboxyvinyl-carboxyphosphonate phosphorylmutase
MTGPTRRERYRAILQGSRCIHPGSVFDPISARIAAESGYEIGVFAGSVASLAVLGAPDIVLLTLSEFVEQARRITRASDLPVMVDADHGYGNALNVMRTVEELETIGICALTIEDTVLPAVYGATEQTLISLEEGVGKMRAALAARRDKSFVVIARTSAMGLTGTEDALRRIKAYAATGVDAVFMSGVKTKAQIEAAASAMTLPMVLGPLPAGTASNDELAKLNVRILLQGHAPFMAAVQAVYATMQALRAGKPAKEIAGIASAETMQRLTREADTKRSAAAFLGVTNVKN